MHRSSPGEGSWVVLDETGSASRSSSRPSSRVSDGELSEWAESYAHELLPIRRTPDGLKASLGLGLDAQDSIAQAERSLSLAVRLDGIDSDFLKKSTELIEALRALKRPKTPISLGSSLLSEDEVEQDEDEDEDEEDGEDIFNHDFAAETLCRFSSPPPRFVASPHKSSEASSKSGISGTLKYGGRAPPILGANAPRVSPFASFDGSLDTERSLKIVVEQQNRKPELDAMNTTGIHRSPSSPTPTESTSSTFSRSPRSIPGRDGYNNKDERRRRRRERQARSKMSFQDNSPAASSEARNTIRKSVIASTSIAAWLSSWWCGFLRETPYFVSLGLSHAAALVLGVYVGRTFHFSIK